MGGAKIQAIAAGCVNSTGKRLVRDRVNQPTITCPRLDRLDIVFLKNPRTGNLPCAKPGDVTAPEEGIPAIDNQAAHGTLA